MGVAALVPGLDGIESGEGYGRVARILGSASSHGGVLSFLRSDLDRLEDSPFLTAVLGNPFGSWSCGGLGTGVSGLRTSVGEDGFFDDEISSKIEVCSNLMKAMLEQVLLVSQVALEDRRQSVHLHPFFLCRSEVVQVLRSVFQV